MERQRADLGFADTLDEFDPSEWQPKPATTANDKPPKAETKKAAAAAGFRSREPQPVAETPPSDLPRRRRTGRNTQLNLKARPETIAAFCAIADSQGWGLGETLEHAVVLLEREVGSSSRKGRG
jgi:hypothetical protein